MVVVTGLLHLIADVCLDCMLINPYYVMDTVLLCYLTETPAVVYIAVTVKCTKSRQYLQF